MNFCTHVDALPTHGSRVAAATYVAAASATASRALGLSQTNIQTNVAALAKHNGQ